MKDKSFPLADIPHEVWWVWGIQRQGFTGSEGMKQMDEIIKKYPQYFEWETKFNKIGNEVYQAYLDECYPDRHTRWSDIPVSEPSEGILTEIKIKGFLEYKRPNPEDKIDLHAAMKEMFDGMEKAERARIDEKNRIRQIWDKHYKKYKLPFRD